MAHLRENGRSHRIARHPFQHLRDGRLVEAITLSGEQISATVLTYGASLHSVSVPDRHGAFADIVVAPATLDEYVRSNACFGGTIGRYASRINRGQFVLDGVVHKLARNEGMNTLHGGPEGFHQRLWTVVSTSDVDGAQLHLKLISPDGDQGFPGRLTVEAIYAIDQRDCLSITYRAVTDRSTVINITNHTYWNLGGAPSNIGGHCVGINAAHFLPIDAVLMPTGERRSVSNTPFDFRHPVPLSHRLVPWADPQLEIAEGFDHTFIIAPHSHQTVPAARVIEPVSGRAMSIWTNAPGLQLYTGNHLGDTIFDKSGRRIAKGSGLCLEAQRFPDTPNRPAFGSSRLDRGGVYENVIGLSFETLPD